MRVALACAVTAAAAPALYPAAQSRSKSPAKQRIDDAYTAKIKEYVSDPRISTELVDHLPASDTVPSPLKVLGRIVGTPGELSYSKDIYKYVRPDRDVEDRKDGRRARHGALSIAS